MRGYSDLLTLLDEIIDGATNDEVTTANVLRMVKIVGHRGEAVELRRWVDRELNGYDRLENLPSYRSEKRVNVLRSWSGPMCARRQELSIPWDPVHTVVHNRWGAEGLVPRVEYLGVIGVHRVITPGLLRGVIDSVRNTALDFALELQGTAPDAGTQGGPTVADPPVAQVVWNVTNHISGDGAQVAQGENIRAYTSGQVSIAPIAELRIVINDDAECRHTEIDVADLNRQEPQAKGSALWGELRDSGRVRLLYLLVA